MSDTQKKNSVAEPIETYRPGANVNIQLEYFGGEKDDFTVKLPGGLEILELKEAALEATADEDKKDKKVKFKLGLKKDSLIIKLFFENHVVSGRKSMASLLKATPKCLQELLRWIEDNIFSQIPSDTPEEADE